MSYSIEMTVAVKVDQGPPGATQKASIENVNVTRTKQMVFEWREQNAAGTWEYSTQSIVLDRTENDANLRFVAITSDRYTFKDCGKNKPGIGFAFAEQHTVDDKTKPLDSKDLTKGYEKTTEVKTKANSNYEYFSSEQVFIARPGQSLKEFKMLLVRVNRELFDCSQSVNDKVVVTITYGLDKP